MVRKALADKPFHIDNGVFKAYDIRGVVPDQIDTAAAEQVARAFAHKITSKEVIIGRDVRLSGDDFREAVITGLIKSGKDVLDIGRSSTDEFYFACGSKSLPGIMITASHNPPEYNGFKMVDNFPFFVMAKEFRSKIMDERYEDSPDEGQVKSISVREEFVNRMLELVPPSDIKPMKIVVDTSNGSQGAVWKVLRDKLQLDIIPLFWEEDGSFPNHPNDVIQPEAQALLRQKVKETKADLGLIFDPDGDRCLLVDDRGVSVPGDFITALMGMSMVEQYPGATVLYDIRASDAVPDLIIKAGGKPFVWKPGHVYIKAKMKEIGAVFGGEVSGHFYFKDFWYADCGILAGLNLLKYVSRLDGPLSRKVEELESKYFISGEINTAVSNQESLLKELRKKYSDAKFEDLDGEFTGVCAEYPDWHFVVRPSDNEPLVRLTLEAKTKVLMEQKRDEVLGIISRS